MSQEDLMEKIMAIMEKYVNLALSGEFLEDDVPGLINDFLEATGNETKFNIKINYPDGSSRETMGIPDNPEMLVEEQDLIPVQDIIKEKTEWEIDLAKIVNNLTFERNMDKELQLDIIAIISHLLYDSLNNQLEGTDE